MKKIILLSCTFIVATVIFTSCGTTGVSLTKRHYRSGYNLEISSNQTKPDSKRVETQEKQVVTESVTIDVPAEAQYASAGTTNENSYLQHKPFTFDQEDITPETSAKAAVSPKKKKIAGNSLRKISSAAKIATGKNNLSKTFKARDDGSLGGLIWTIAGILLVVWLISLLTGGWGLGGFLHIFLVVALILILLRLLHVL